MERYSLNLDGSFAYGLSQTGARDINLDSTPEFVLAAEGGRPVYAPASSIVTATGASSINASRVHPEFGSVTEIMSQLRSQSAQVTATVGGFTVRGMRISGSYTFLRSRDQQNGFGVGGGGFGGASTAGNPNLVEWGTSDFERRHSMLATVTMPVASWLDATAIGRVTAGQAYTPVTSGDVNGDGARNDRAFIFDPASATDTAVANGMSRLLASTSGRARACLESQLGSVAGRNSCSTPWLPALDVQLNFKPAALGLDRRLTLSLQLQNVLVGVDQLLHGSELRGWGQPIIPDRTLLYVRGFERSPVGSGGSYRYQVNEHFGTASGRNSAFRVPFQVGLQGRLALGRDPARQQVRQLFGGADGRAPTRADYVTRMSRLVPNPFLQAIALDDSLKLALSPEQKQRLGALSDSLKPRSDKLVEEIADILAGAGRNPDPMVIFARVGGKTADARKLAEDAIAQLRGTLSREQFEKLPDSVTTVPVGRGPGGLGGLGGFGGFGGPGGGGAGGGGGRPTP